MYVVHITLWMLRLFHMTRVIIQKITRGLCEALEPRASHALVKLTFLLLCVAYERYYLGIKIKSLTILTSH
jgi:hypothetical protein